MKRLIALIFLPALMWASGNTLDVSLSAAGSTSAVIVRNYAHMAQFNFTATPSVCTARIEGSLDGKNWSDLTGTQSCVPSTYTTTQAFGAYGVYATYVRVYLLTYTGTGSVEIIYDGK